MSRVCCPECGHRFYAPVTDDEVRFEEDVDWDLATRTLRRARHRANVNAIVSAIRTARPVINVTSVIRQSPAPVDPDRPR